MEAASSDPVSVTAWTLPSMTSGAAQAADLVGLGLAIHAPDPRAERCVATGLFDLVGDAQHVERLRGPLVHRGGVRDEVQDNPLCRGAVRGPDDPHSICLEGGHGPFHSAVVRAGAPPPGQRSIRVEFDLFDQRNLLPVSIYLR